MIDPISFTTGLLSLVTFAYGACQSLFQVIEDFQNQPKDISYLKGELESLKDLLFQLFSVVSQPSANNDADLDRLKHPLLGCGEACKYLEMLIRKCTKHSNGKRPSVRDLATLKFRANQIKGVQKTLAVYKATIGLTLGSANLLTTRVTKQALDDYNKIILKTIQELKEHLSQIDNRLKDSSTQDITSSDKNEELERLLKEKHRIHQCLHICRQISESINLGQSAIVLDDAWTADNTQPMPNTTVEENLTADETTSRFLDRFSLDRIETTSKLEQRWRVIQDKLKCFPVDAVTELDEIIAERCQQKNHRDALVGCLSACQHATQRSEQARTNVFEDVYAAKGASQFAISDVGDLISAKRVRAERGANQVLGQISDLSLLHSLDRHTTNDPKDYLSSTSAGANEARPPRNAITWGGYNGISDLKNLLLLVMFVLLVGNM